MQENKYTEEIFPVNIYTFLKSELVHFSLKALQKYSNEYSVIETLSLEYLGLQ